MRFAFVPSILSLAAFAAAPRSAHAQAPAGVENNENVFIRPSAADVVAVASQPFDLQWTPSANPGTITIVLVKGAPPGQVVETVAQSIPNTGNFQWVPQLSLEGLQTMPADQGYGFKIINDISGNFGVSQNFKLDSPGSTFNPAVSSAPLSESPATATAEIASTESTLLTSATSISSEDLSSSVVSSTDIPTTTATDISSSTADPTTSDSSTITESTSESTSESQTSTTPTTLSTVELTSSTLSTVVSPTSKPSFTSSTAAETTSASGSAATETSAPAAAGGQLGAPAIAGITAGVVGGIALIIVAVFLIRRRKQTANQRLVGSTPAAAPSKYDRDFQMMERRARHRPTSSFGFNTSRSDASGGIGGLATGAAIRGTAGHGWARGFEGRFVFFDHSPTFS
ncbi:hypothetical protein DRE_01014 [Drechslerella stenobrocha 248]|uniref:Mid2 domain-containing protein n=1 Tax=Drechslerella stenobrocha 248 TaxID=1043628 RepID=W7I7L7_9PEZI|nr:hypothetical protein DRE_01014 [Drechslerella stenobrocha 248]